MLRFVPYPSLAARSYAPARRAVTEAGAGFNDVPAPARDSRPDVSERSGTADTKELSR
jgi:hypothetical protein